MEKKKILVVDDEIKISSLIKKILESENFFVELAFDGKGGLVMAEKGNYDLIILDIMLPRLNGLEVCKLLRENNIQIPILILTARDTIEDRLNATETGADDYLSKPFDMKDFLIKVEALINKKNVLIEKKEDSFWSDKEYLKLAAINKKIMDNVPVSIITIDKQGNFTSANKYYYRFSKSKDFHGNNIFSGKFFSRENLVEDYKKLLLDGSIVQRDHLFERNDKGEDKYLKITAVPLLDKEGNIEGALSMALDNTESVLLQRKLQLANEELEIKVKQRTAELDTANQELAKVMELKSMFVADVSHEMRTSLAIIQGNIELLSRNLLEKDEIIQSYGQIFNEINRMSNMLSDMTLLSESETSRMRLDLKEIDLNEIIEKQCLSVKKMAKEKSIIIRHKNSKKKALGFFDEVQIEKLILNLLQNAIRYNKPGGNVDIWIEKVKENILIKVKDTGIGIPKEYQRDIFERFYRVDKARSRNEGGSGLGLAICKWVAEVHDGKIEVDSVVGEGSTFTVSLPILQMVNNEE